MKADEIIYIQWAAKLVAAHYRLRNTMFIVSKNSTLDAVARVEIRNSDEIFVEYNYTGSLNICDLWAVMAHEVAHIFLDRLGLRFEETLQNEVLTDCAAIYLGFGRYYLSAQREEVSFCSPNQTVTRLKTLGYISPSEMGYILAHRDYVRNESSLEKIRSDIGVAGYKEGMRWFEKEKNQRPYLRRTLMDRTMYRFGWLQDKESDAVTFECIICKRGIRIPALHKAMKVKCPNCSEQLTCYS